MSRQLTKTVTRPSFGVQRQMNVYTKGAMNKQPSLPVAYEDLVEAAREKLSEEAFAYVMGGAGAERTMQSNREAFYRWQIIPRMLVDVSQRDMGVRLFGQDLPSPVLLGPVGVLGIVHEEAELAVARAAHSLGIPQIVSTVSSHPMEEVAAENRDNPCWFQLYWGDNHEFTKSIIRRAEKAGYSALVVTLDTPMLAWRERDIQLAYLPFLKEQGLVNYYNDPVFRARVGDPRKNKYKAFYEWTKVFSGPRLTWEDLKVIRRHTRIPMILKGIQHVEDAKKAINYGADGIIVSNHGGRQLDGAIGSLDVLKEIADAVRDQTTLIFDSGIRRGADVFKAMALGAQAVCVARPYVLGLGLGGEKGVKEVMSNLLADVDLTLGLAGCASWKDVGEDCLRRGVV
jgi:lactate 2-monooxygenase